METQYAQCYLVWQWDICTLCVELEATFLIDSQFSRYLIHTIRPVNLDACPTHPGWILNNPTYSAWAVGSVGYKECKTVIEDIVTSELCTASVCLDKSIRKESISNLLQPHKPTKTYMLAELWNMIKPRITWPGLKMYASGKGIDANICSLTLPKKLNKAPLSPLQTAWTGFDPYLAVGHPQQAHSGGNSKCKIFHTQQGHCDWHNAAGHWPGW